MTIMFNGMEMADGKMVVAGAVALPRVNLITEPKKAIAVPAMEFGNASVSKVAATLLDSGASRVMLMEEKWFVSLKRSRTPLQVAYADGAQYDYW